MLTQYTVRRLRPEDAPGVTALTERVYGETYTVPEMYHPEQIVRLNQAEQLISVVALDASGKVVGLLDLDRREHHQVAEATDAMVLPEHQHQHLLEQMRQLLEAEAHRLGLVGMFGMPVTNHVFSQRAEEHFGSRLCGVVLGSEPASFHNTAESLPRRMSEVIYFKFLRPERIVAYLPPHHRDICGRIYAQFEVAVDFAEPNLPAGPGKVQADYLPEEQWCMVHVHQVGVDSAAEVQRLRQHYCSCWQVDALYVGLPLSSRGRPPCARRSSRPASSPPGPALRGRRRRAAAAMA